MAEQNERRTPIVGTDTSVSGTMTGTTVITSKAIQVGNARAASIQAKWTGTPVGSFAFEVSNDDDPVNNPKIGFTSLTLPSSFSAGNPTGTASNFMFEFDPIAWKWLRAKYTNASSTGVLDMVAEAKGN